MCSSLMLKGHAAVFLLDFPVLSDCNPLSWWMAPAVTSFPDRKHGVIPDFTHPVLVPSGLVAEDSDFFLLDIFCQSPCVFLPLLHLTPTARVTILEWRSDKSCPCTGPFGGSCAHVSLGSHSLDPLPGVHSDP